MPTTLTSQNITALQLKEGATPGTPSSGYGRLYVNASGVLHYVDDAGTDIAIGGAGGSAHTIRENGTNLTARTGLNFINGIIATDDAAGDESEVAIDYAGTADLADVAAAESAGAAVTVPRGDHVHAHGSGYLPNAHHNQAHAAADHNAAALPGTANENFGAFYHDVSQIAAPANPGAGVRRVYVDSGTGKISVRTSGGSSVSLEEQGGGVTFGPPTGNIDIGDAQVEGVSANATRADHQHVFTAPAAAYPLDVAAAEADGTATTPARSDHVHAHGSGYLANAHHNQAHVLADGAALGADHTISGAAAGEVLRALSATTAAFDVLQHADLGGVTSDQHHARSHDHSNASDGTALLPESVEITGGPFALRGDISPAQIAADQNDYNPAGLADATTLRLSTDASRNLTGLAGGADGRIITIFNIGSFNLVLVDESASSTAANRFALSSNLTIAGDEACTLQYDATSSRWRLISGPLGAGSSGYNEVQDEGTALTARTQLNFVGPVVIADDNASKTRVRVLDPITMAFASDEFLTGDTTTGEIGSLGWNSSGGTVTTLASVAGRPGINRRETTTTINTFALNRNSSTIDPADTFDLTFIFRLNQTDSDTTLRIGLANTFSAAPADGIYLEKLGADINWFYITNAAAETRTDSGVAAGTGWFRLRIRRKDASTIAFSLDGGAETDVTANIPTAAMFWGWQITNAAAANKTMDMDYTHLLVTGLSR